jgi:hypothetical protein
VPLAVHQPAHGLDLTVVVELLELAAPLGVARVDLGDSSPEDPLEERWGEGGRCTEMDGSLRTDVPGELTVECERDLGRVREQAVVAGEAVEPDDCDPIDLEGRHAVGDDLGGGWER